MRISDWSSDVCSSDLGQPSQAAAQAQAAAAEASWEDVSMVDPLGLEVGYRLIPLVDHSQNGELLHRIRSLRKKFAQDVGFLPPVVHIRDNLELKPNDRSEERPVGKECGGTCRSRGSTYH